MPTGRGTWARISWHRPGWIFPREFSGLEASTAVRGVPRPDFLQAVHWTHGGFVCRAEEMTFVDQRTVSAGYVVDEPPRLPESWWTSLSLALVNLAATDTDRVSLVQEDIDRSITQAFGGRADTTVSDWCIGHGDLHWGNVTAPELFLLDWDSWGRVPRGLDTAKLWEASYRVPELGAEIIERFPVLSTRDGLISRVWVCANRVLGARRRGKNTVQADHAHRAGMRLLQELAL
ncbi:hypothetical protein [Nocardiopsis dassonvillei]|uniref:hypothetical protein n=1 Tax=Nocardiopsis dassonvillei TaxID=2014 RepID=UPI0033E235E6